MYLPDVTIFVPIVPSPVSGSDFETRAVVLPENVIVSPAASELVVAVYFKRGAVKSTTVPVAPLTLLVNVSPSVIAPDTVLRTA